MNSKKIEPITEFFSLNQNYRAVIFPDKKNFSVQIYKWNEALLDNDGLPLWERICDPIIVENQKAAELLAQKNLALFSGETPDISSDENFHELVRSVLGHENFVFLEEKNFSVLFLKNADDENFSPIKVNRVLAVEEFYFVEAEDKDWCSGFLYQEGEIRCWKKFKNLETALLEILEK